MKIYVMTLLLLMLDSCSTSQERPKAKHNYSKETEVAFDNIEKSNAIETYRKLREKNWKKYNKKTQKRKKYKSKPKLVKKYKKWGLCLKHGSQKNIHH